MNPEDSISLQNAKESKKINEIYLRKLKSSDSENTVPILRKIHHEVFQITDCLSCANCCKTTPALITRQDVKRIARFLHMPASQFLKLYIITDFDGEMMMKNVPCVFLNSENYCAIYEVRPESCRRFPHTDEKEYPQRISLNITNTTICPAAAMILERLKKAIPLSI